MEPWGGPESFDSVRRSFTTILQCKIVRPGNREISWQQSKDRECGGRCYLERSSNEPASGWESALAYLVLQSGSKRNWLLLGAER